MRRLVAAAVVAGLFVALAPVAGAFMREGIAVSREQGAEKSYPPIAGNYQAVAANFTPSGCGDETNTAPFQTFCDRIPLKIAVPELDAADEFFVTIELSWDNPSGQNDLDMWVWDDTQIAKREDPESGTYTELAAATSADQNPEIAKLFRPELGDYNVTVMNALGPNTGYKLKVYMTVARGDEIFELLEQPAAPTVDNSGGDAPPVDYSADAPAAGAGGVSSAPFAPPQNALDELAILPDSDLDSGFDSNFESALTAPDPGGDTAALINERPDPVSGLTVFLWLAVVPLTLGAGALWFLRRRRVAFQFG